MRRRVRPLPAPSMGRRAQPSRPGPPARHPVRPVHMGRRAQPSRLHSPPPSLITPPLPSTIDNTEANPTIHSDINCSSPTCLEPSTPPHRCALTPCPHAPPPSLLPATVVVAPRPPPGGTATSMSGCSPRSSQLIFRDVGRRRGTGLATSPPAYLIVG
ncbi:hypothetical protein VPH35_047129 [Triticum aestivum]